MRASRLFAWTVLALVPSLFTSGHPAVPQQSPAVAAAVVEKPETVEWVYRIRYGYHDEWFRIFRKDCQTPELGWRYCARRNHSS
jgi:hypothetical protein